MVLGIEFDYILDKLPKPSSNVVQALMLSVRAADPEVQTQMERAAAGDRAVSGVQGLCGERIMGLSN